jgi:translation initiation factor IF-3
MARVKGGLGAKKKQKVVELKEIRLSPNIDLNDLNTKMNAAKKFLSKGDKVKITLRFRGREMAHMNASKHILDDLKSDKIIYIISFGIRRVY